MWRWTVRNVLVEIGWLLAKRHATLFLCWVLGIVFVNELLEAGSGRET